MTSEPVPPPSTHRVSKPGFVMFPG
jgi:hypothetical protein